ncbi:hypothetical protein IWQ60_012157 [Tieghemiomyces parasiticus]|uniref:2-oxo-4-hydroxy-4-carboxy-5-ureidoimidazoline decarboxylase n=1 Tax=Tieghemiomyces parasiticus TaxID=78921 RepID=A0A9W7ZM68_9FUNG|nr:hypothetical protein IWQ60_012157 [Tieghemiomyces parasiticus]
MNVFFESADVLGDRLYRCRPFTSYPAVLQAADGLLRNATALSDAERVAVINAHPRLGSRDLEQLSVLSRAEQSGGLPGAPGTRTESEPREVEAKRALLETFAQLNRAYEDKYGFRFLIFVDGRSKEELLPVFQDRLHKSSREKEMETALHDTIHIAGSRLRVLLPADQL